MITTWLLSASLLLLLTGDNNASRSTTRGELAAASSIFAAAESAAVQLPPRSTCRVCDRPTRVCICDALPPSPIRTSTHLLILQHPAESRRKHTGTAALLPLCLLNCVIVRGTHFVPEDLSPLRDALNAGVRPLLLFPGPSARVALSGEDSNDRHARKCTTALLIAVDGTWRQAHHMLRHSPDLVAACDVVYLPDRDARSELDSLRREPASHCTSTAEAIAAALCFVEPTDRAAEAAEYIRSSVKAMVVKQLEHSNVAPTRVETQKQRSLRRLLSPPSEDSNAVVMQPMQFAAGSDKVSREFAEGKILYKRVDPIRVPLINAFYRAHQYRAVAKRSDVVWEARNASDSTLMAAMRLVPKRCAELGTVSFVRNLFVSDAFRRRGIGTNLVRAAFEAEKESMPYYCFADEELVPLYRAAGLEVLDVQTVPEWMAEEFTRVGHQQSQILVLLGRAVNSIDEQTSLSTL